MTGALEIGVIVKPHGIRGALKVRLHWSESAAFGELSKVTVVLPSGEGSVAQIEALARAGDFLVLNLRGVCTRIDAEKLRAARLLVNRTQLPELKPGEFYLADLVGASAVLPDGVLGRIVSVKVHPTVDTAVIVGAEGNEMELVLDEAWVDGFDPDSRILSISSADGIIGS